MPARVQAANSKSYNSNKPVKICRNHFKLMGLHFRNVTSAISGGCVKGQELFVSDLGLLFKVISY